MLISVVVCTHNPDLNLLIRCLEAISNQIKSDYAYELIVIDNCSNIDFKGHIPDTVQFKYIYEERLGLTYARLRGIEISKGGYICFVDDDNILDDDYLININEIVSCHSKLGCFGAGIISPIFEKIPDASLIPYIGSLALRNEIEDQISNDISDYYYPYGAGMVVRRDVALKYSEDVVNSELKLSLDRKGNQLNSCGDDHFSWIAIRMGLQKGVFTTLKLKHYIPRNRVQKEYLLRMAESFGYSRSLLFHINGKEFPGLRIITSNHSNIHQVPAWIRLLYSFYINIKKKMLFPNRSLESEFIDARNKGVLRFYNTVYLKEIS
jgi:glycosyltransferase involved in cell wall biosynthesis